MPNNPADPSLANLLLQRLMNADQGRWSGGNSMDAQGRLREEPKSLIDLLADELHLNALAGQYGVAGPTYRGARDDLYRTSDTPELRDKFRKTVNQDDPTQGIFPGDIELPSHKHK